MILYHSHEIFAALAVVATTFPSSISALVPANMNNTDIPWQDLKDALSAEATLLPASNQDYIDQCYPEFESANRNFTRLINQPSGLCLFGLSCGFENCFPPGSDWDNWSAIKALKFENLTTPLKDLNIDIPLVEEWMDPDYSTFNVPNSVLFPAVAGDVVAAVKFARDNSLGVSVKNSGHSYTGASGKKDTLLVNTHKYKKYSPTGIAECSTKDISLLGPDLANQACLLALSRGKKAYVRVGGGENWGDVYSSVHEFNNATANFTYHVVGGAAPSVTPMGWTFQGGLGATAGSRMFGLGVDQVLQIEAVLPNGQHVRFGPTSWEAQEGFLYPRTTAVSGLCNTSPNEEDEKNWKWESCPMEINFDDLWFAFRGGGGGTWGVVTSIYLQLHDYRPMEWVAWPYHGSCLQWTPDITKLLIIFLLDYFLNPALFGVSQEESNACGTAPDLIVFCYGEGTGTKLASTWKSYLQNQTEFADCMELSVHLDKKDYWEFKSDPANYFSVPYYPSLFANELDLPSVSYPVLIPLSLYNESRQMILDIVQGTDLPLLYMSFYMSFGGNVAFANDQTTSISKAHRQAAIMYMASESFIAPFGLASFTGNTGNGAKIPGFVGGNHYSPYSFGPLKSDPTKFCTYNSLEEAEENCYPTQVAVWGSENLARLEQIKEEIDPNYIFDCNKCVGNNRKSTKISKSAKKKQKLSKESKKKKSKV